MLVTARTIGSRANARQRVDGAGAETVWCRAMHRPPTARAPRVSDRAAQLLRAHLTSFDASRHRLSDPVDLVHRFTDARDREVVALLASALAFGRVAGIRASVERVLDILGPRPARALRALDSRAERVALSTFKHRWCTGDDVIALLIAARRAMAESRTLERFFAEGDDSRDPDTHAALASFFRRLAQRAGVDARRPRSRGLEFLLPRTAGPSPLKRGHLFLRWLVRPADGIDLGVWTRVDRARLLVPLDTHVARIAFNLGFTTRRTVDVRMAREVTSALRVLDPRDPLRYDFALCHIGISGECPSRRRDEVCVHCAMQSLCVHWGDGTQTPRTAG